MNEGKMQLKGEGEKKKGGAIQHDAQDSLLFITRQINRCALVGPCQQRRGNVAPRPEKKKKKKNCEQSVLFSLKFLVGSTMEKTCNVSSFGILIALLFFFFFFFMSVYDNVPAVAIGCGYQGNISSGLQFESRLP